MESRELVSGVLELCVRGGRDIHSTQRSGPRSAAFHVAYSPPPLSLIANLGSGATRYPGFNVSLFANCRACAIMSQHAGCDADGLCRPKIGSCVSCCRLRMVASHSLVSCFLLSVLLCFVGGGGFCPPLSHAQILFHRSALAGRSSVTPVLLFGAVRFHLTRRQTC